MLSEKVQGFCPMGCGETLFLGSGGYVTCSYLECPAATAVSDILDNRETEHVVEVREDDFTVQHSLRERLNGDMFACGLHVWMAALPGPPVKPGRYRAVEQEDPVSPWHFVELPADDQEGDSHDA